MRLLTTITIATMLLAAGNSIAQEDNCGRTRCARARGRATSDSSPPFFEFAPTSGAGMGTACSCAAVTGSKGETMSFTRGSSATCLKGNVTSGISNGDMVTCASHQPRVSPGPDGSGPLMLLSEVARTNLILRSEELENAAWSVGNAIVAAPVITANAAVAPDGTTTADRVQLPTATGSGRYSQLYQAVTFAGASSCTLFVKGNGTSGTVDVTYGTVSTACLACAYVAGSWTRCSFTATLVGAGSVGVASLNSTDYGGFGCGGAAFDGFVWGVQCETGAFPTSYIATAGSTVTRATDLLIAAAPAAAAFDTQGSTAATIVMQESTGAVGGISQYTSANRPLYVAAGKASIYDATNLWQSAAGSAFTTRHRFWSSWAGSSMTATNATDAKSVTGAFDGSMLGGATYVEIAQGTSGAAALNGWIGQVCYDTSATRCR